MKYRIRVSGALECLLGCLLLGGLAGAQVALQKSVALDAATIYINPDKTSTAVGTVQPGQTVGVQSTSANGYAEVFNGVSGWIENRGLVRLDDLEAPEVIFGAAVRLQNQAENNPGERPAAAEAAQLFETLYENFPASALAGEALYRSASIRWQVALGEEPVRRTARERLFPDDSQLHRVMSKFGGTPWAARADYLLLVEHFTCGDWSSSPDCVAKEISTYKDYVKKYPQGPVTPEADYDAIYREAIAWTLYSASGAHQDTSKADDYKRLVAADADQMQQLYPSSDWTAQAALLAFNVAENTPMNIPATTPMGGP